MKSVHLLRHAKSSWKDPGLNDHDRPLSKRGRQTAKMMAAYLRAGNAQPPLGHLHGDRAQKITFADVHAAMAQDRVGGCEMEIEVRQHKMV